MAERELADVSAAYVVVIETTKCDEHDDAGGGVVCNEVESGYPKIVACSYDRAYAIDFVKGAVLHVIGDWKKVPSTIRFEVREKSDASPVKEA